MIYLYMNFINDHKIHWNIIWLSHYFYNFFSIFIMTDFFLGHFLEMQDVINIWTTSRLCNITRFHLHLQFIILHIFFNFDFTTFCTCKTYKMYLDTQAEKDAQHPGKFIFINFLEQKIAFTFNYLKTFQHLLRGKCCAVHTVIFDIIKSYIIIFLIHVFIK